MLVEVFHRTEYRYAEPAQYTIQSLKLTPSSTGTQQIRDWFVDTGHPGPLPAFVDSFGNLTHTLTLRGPHDAVRIVARGRVWTEDNGGVLRNTPEPFPLPGYLRPTSLTAPTPTLRELALAHDEGPGEEVNTLHGLMNAIRAAITYRTGETDARTTAADALARGSGVCQDHAHVFLAACRLLGLPARYVSGYLIASDDPHATHTAAHAWAEAHVPEIGWIGFDVSNGVCPGEGYVRLAVGLDYREAAPIRGIQRGGSEEDLTVEVRVAAAASQQ
jgi:transglutaminase-like putative cysteine protease